MELPSLLHSKTKRYIRLVCNKYTYLILGIVALALLYVFNPSSYWFWPKCPMRLITHLSCPACGIQRFLHALTNGDVKGACHYNYFLIYALPYTLIIVLIYYLPSGRLKDRMAHIFEGKTATWIYVISFSIWFVVRNILNI